MKNRICEVSHFVAALNEVSLKRPPTLIKLVDRSISGDKATRWLLGFTVFAGGKITGGNLQGRIPVGSG